MARTTITATVGQSLGEGRYNSSAGGGRSTSVDVASAVADLATLTTDVATAQTATDAVKVATAALETGIIALDALADVAVAAKVAGAAVAAVTTAMGVLQADGASPTEAHVDTADAAWITVAAAITALHTAVDNVKTASALRETDAIAADALVDTAKTATDALDTSAVSTDLTAIDADDAADLVMDINLSTITTRNALRSAVNAALHVAAGSSQLTS